METRFTKGQAHSMSATDANGQAWQITTTKGRRGVECSAVQGLNSGGTFSYELFGAKRLELALEEGIATQKRIEAVHAKGLAEFTRIMAEKAETEPAPYEIKIGQVFFTWFQDGEKRRRAVYEIESPGRYLTVHLDGECVEHDSRVKPYSEKFGIGDYYKEGDTIPAEEAIELVRIAREREVARIQAKETEQKQADEQKANAIAEGAKIIQRIPAGAVAVLVAHLREDDSDILSDYFNYKTVKNVYLAFSNHTKDLFSEMRAAAANFPETANLATCPKEWEHREKYSMGAGYYLGESKFHGWIIEKQNIGGNYGRTLEEFQIAAAEGRFFCKSQITPSHAAPELTTGEQATIRINEQKGGVELYFPGKPAASVLEDLKANGFRWGKFNKCWYMRDCAKAREIAGKYAQLPETANNDELLVQAEQNAAIDRWAADNL